VLGTPNLGPAALVLATYLLGSVSFALLWARARGVDLRAVGSGNLGATNIARALGRDVGRRVMLLDALKGLVPVLVARQLFGEDSVALAGAGFAAVLGHCFPLWHGLRGGKGAATGAGVMLGAVPGAGAAALVVFVVVRKLAGHTSVGSLAGVAVGAALTPVLTAMGDPRTGMVAALAALVVARHVPNLRRLWRGEEPPS
jgi:glycerol-3-phosphate acyltransferase PlsY